MRPRLLPLKSAIFILLSGYPFAAEAAAPEVLEQVEPSGGEWQLQLTSDFASGEPRTHQLEVAMDLGQGLSIGVELEGEEDILSSGLESVAASALFRFPTAGEGPLDAGIKFSLEHEGGRLARGEARMILSTEMASSRLETNLMLRRGFAKKSGPLEFGYAMLAARPLWRSMSIGVEGSGQIGFGVQGQEREGTGHFVGPTLAAELERPGAEVEFAVSLLQRWAGEGPSTTLRLTTQVTFGGRER